MNHSFELTVKHRIETVEVPSGIKQIQITVSRNDCMDVLLELVNMQGKAKGKPLQKHLPMILTKKQTCKLRFMMNDFSTKPILISLLGK